jgi:lysophospholipase L1-like esterase
VLHIGDSFVDAFFAQNLAPRFRAAGARYVVQAETATYTTSWASSAELDFWLEDRPSLVLITLGANEVTLPAPEARARAVERLVQRVSAVTPSCVWITPVTWKGDTGILQVIHDHCGPCLFFDSDAVVGELSASERQPDRIHPSTRGGARWAAAFWDWLVDHRDPSAGPWSLTRFERRL